MLKNLLKEKFSQLLRHELVRNRCRQNVMAEKLGITPSAVSQMLQGKIVPSIKQLDVFCEMLGLDRQRVFELRCMLSRIRCGGEEMPSPLGELIVNLRRERGMSPAELAFAASLSEKMVTLLETTPDVTPDAADLKKIAAALDIQPEQLYNAAGLDRRVHGSTGAPIRGLDALILREPTAKYSPKPKTASMQLKKFWQKLTAVGADVYGEGIAATTGIAQGKACEIIAKGSELDLTACSLWKLTIKDLASLCPGELALARHRKTGKRMLLAVDYSRGALVGRKLFRKSNKAMPLSEELFDIIVPIESITLIPGAKS